MQKENDSSASASTSNKDAVAATGAGAGAGVEAEEAAPVEEAGKMSLDDALEVAIAATSGDESKAKAKAKVKEGVEGSKDAADTKADRTSDDRATRKDLEAPANNGRAARGKSGAGEVAGGKLEAPAGWTTDEKADFYASSKVAQEAAIRLEKSRSRTVEEIRLGKEQLAREREEVSWAKDVVKEITPFLRTRGENGPTHAQVIKALKVVNEIDANTKGAVAEILKAKGIPVPKELENAGVSTIEGLDEKLTPLQNEIKLLKEDRDRERLHQLGTTLRESWLAFESSKNAAGVLKYPDVGNDESGIKRASSIGSLVSGKHEDSVGFFAYVKARIPNATNLTLIEEAYKWFGGKVDDSETPRTQDTQKRQLLRSSKAASSVPGRAVDSSSAGVKKYKTLEEAQKAALEFLRESE